MLLALTPEAASSPTTGTRLRAAPPERVLMDAICSGDERLAAQVHAALLPVVHATLGRVLGSSRSHEPLTQRCIEGVISAIAHHPSPSVCKLAAWTTAASARVALEVLRSRARSEVAWGDTLHRTSDDDPAGGSPGSAIERLRWLLAELPLQQAEAIVLCDVMGLGPTEVAVILGVGLEHVRRLLVAGHERLARALT